MTEYLPDLNMTDAEADLVTLEEMRAQPEEWMAALALLNFDAGDEGDGNE